MRRRGAGRGGWADSGSAFLDRQGRALGVLRTLQIAPAAGSNGVRDVGEELAYMRANDGPNAEFALGTEAFRGPLLP